MCECVVHTAKGNAIGKWHECSNLETMTKSAFADRELYGSAEIIIAIDKGKHKILMHEHERIWRERPRRILCDVCVCMANAWLVRYKESLRTQPHTHTLTYSHNVLRFTDKIVCAYIGIWRGDSDVLLSNKYIDAVVWMCVVDTGSTRSLHTYA